MITEVCFHNCGKKVLENDKAVDTMIFMLRQAQYKGLYTLQPELVEDFYCADTCKALLPLQHLSRQDTKRLLRQYSRSLSGQTKLHRRAFSFFRFHVHRAVMRLDDVLHNHCS